VKGVAGPRRPVLRLIAAVLLLQSVLAPAHCLAMAAPPAGLQAVICSPDGTRLVHLGPDGQEAPAHGAADGFCAACGALPQVALPAPPRLPAPGGAATAPAWHAAAPAALPPPARGPPFAPRAPPAFG
jgi:hypothetical protein